MQKTAISWTNKTWNPVHGCSKVSQGCKFCYAMTLSLRYGWTQADWTIPNEEENVLIKPHKLHEPFKLGDEPQRVFVNSMSDLFHRQIPDWYRAAIFNVMLANPQHVFQVLTKRPDAAIDWHQKYADAVESSEYRAFIGQVKNKQLRAALEDKHDSPWGAGIWMGATVEHYRVIARLDHLRAIPAQVRFVSAEPLIGNLAHPTTQKIDFSGIHWVIAGGESGLHLQEDKYKHRWMKMEWARAVRDNCVDQGVAFFYKQDSGLRTELRPYIVEPDGSRWKWEQYPGDLNDPVNYDTGESRPADSFVTIKFD